MNIRPTAAHACAAICICLALHTGAALAQPAAKESGKDLVAHAVELMHTEDVPIVRLQAIVINGVEQAKIGLEQRLPADKMQPVMADIGGIAHKTLDEVTPAVRDAGVKLAPGVIGPLLREKFTDDELRQLIAVLDSPVRKKYEAMLPEIQQAIGQAVTEQTHTQVTPKLQDMGKQISARIAQALQK